MSTSRDDFGIAIRSALLQRGAKQKFSLFVLILTSIIIFTLDNIKLKPISVFRSLINDGVYRISAIFSSPIKASGATKDFFVNHIFVYKENERLKNELEELKKEKLRTSFLETENKRLQEIINLEEDTSFITVSAKIMLDKNSPYLNSAIINKGANSKIKIGMPVLSGNSLVGRIVEVNFLSSRILLLNDLNSRIPVVISPKGDQAILTGAGRKRPVLEYLPDNYQINNGSKVYTSGKDGVLFSGISIGEYNYDQVRKRAEVILLSDPNQLYLVNVVLEEQTDTEAM